jgi:hypothetical protein
MKLIAAALLCSLAAGCAGSRADCGPDWRAIGQRDGRLGATPQADIYARRCGVTVDADQYTQGWRDGYSMRPTPTW